MTILHKQLIESGPIILQFYPYFFYKTLCFLWKMVMAQLSLYCQCQPHKILLGLSGPTPPREQKNIMLLFHVLEHSKP